MKLPARLGCYREAERVQGGRGLTGRWLVALDRVSEQWIGGEADAQKI